MERQSSVFGKLRSMTNSNVDPSSSSSSNPMGTRIGQDEWFIPYNANIRPNLTTRESGIGLSPVPLRPVQNRLLSSVFPPSSSSTNPPPFAENSRPNPIQRPTTTPAHSYLSPTKSFAAVHRPMPRRTGTIVKSTSYNSISDMTMAMSNSNPLDPQRIPSSSSVPTGLTAPKMLFSPMERELRGGGATFTNLQQPQHQSQTRPHSTRKRSVSAPRPRQNNPYEYRAEGRKWVVPTMCDMFVFPRPHLYPHAITPPESPVDETNRYSLITGTSDDDAVVEQAAARAQEREGWAELVRRRGRSLSFGGQSSAPPGAPVIGNVRARSREASRSNSIVRRNSSTRDSQSEGRKRSMSFGSRFTSRSRRSSISRNNSDNSSFSDIQGGGGGKPIPFNFGVPSRPLVSSNSRKPTRTSGQSFFADQIRDNDPFASTRPYDSAQFRRTHGHTISEPLLDAPIDSRYPPLSAPASRALQFKQPTVADKGGVVIITGKQLGGRKTSGMGTFKPPPPLDLSKPLPDLPSEGGANLKSPILPETGPFFPLSDDIGVAISPSMAAIAQMADDNEDFPRQEPRTAPLPSAQSLSPHTPLTGRSSDSGSVGGGSATARAFLAKQHQRARARRAFQSPVQGPTFKVQTQRREVSSPLSASTQTTASTTSAMTATQATDSPRRKTALEEAIGRSRAASVDVLDQQDLDSAKARSGIYPRPRTAENEQGCTMSQFQLTSPPPKITLDSPRSQSKDDFSKMNRGMTSPPLIYPITTMPSPRTTVFTDADEDDARATPNSKLLGFQLERQRPEFTHNDTGISKTTVYTDASEGWSRAVDSGRSTPISGLGVKPRFSYGDTQSDAPSPQMSMDDRDFQGLFFRTPDDRNGSFSQMQSGQIHERYAPPFMSRVIPDNLQPIGLGYGLEQNHSRREPGFDTSDDRRPSDGSEPTDEITTPVIVSEAQQSVSIPMITMAQDNDYVKHSHSRTLTHLHERRSSASKPVAPFVNGRPVTPESMISRSDSYDERKGQKENDIPMDTQRTAVPLNVDGPEFPFPRATGDGEDQSTQSATIETPNGKRRTSSISPPHLSPGTFGIASSSPSPSTDQQITTITNTFASQAPFNPSYSLSPYDHTRSQKRSISRSPQTQIDALSPTLGAEASPIPGYSPRHSAAVSFFDDFPSPPSFPSKIMSSSNTTYPSPAEKHASAFGQLVTGPPGAGKSTYCHGLHQFLTAIGRPVHIINLDPAVSNPPYPCSISITELITLESVQEEYGLGPNGAILYCVEYLEANFDWLQQRLDEVLNEDGGNGYVVFDTPGQVELWTNHDSLKKIVAKLIKSDYRLAAVHLSDAHYITDASKFISVTLLALRAMLQLEMPHVNVLSKIDLLSTYGELPFDLSYYTQVQDLSYLLDKLNDEPRARRFGKLNKAMGELVDQFGLVGFETLAVEDKTSMINLLRLVDKMTGYIFLPSNTNTNSNSTTMENVHALFSSASSARLGSDIRDVQERWVDNKDAYDEWEKEMWKAEGQMRATRRQHDDEH